MTECLVRVMSGIAAALAAVAGAALLYMMMVTVADIVGRSLHLFTINSGVEQAELLMTVIAFLGLAQCIRVEGNIVVDIATGRLPDRVNALIDAFWQVIMAGVLALLAVLVLDNGLASDRLGQRSELLGLSPLVGHSVAAFGMAVAVVVALTLAWTAFRRASRSEASGKESQ